MITLKINSNIRKIDELGRIVIPRDIRKKMHILENDSLEIYIEDNAIKMEKYSIITDYRETLDSLLDMTHRITGNNYIIADKIQIIASNNKDYIDTPSSQEIVNFISNKEPAIDLLQLHDKAYTSSEFNILPLNIDSINQGVIIEFKSNGNDNLNLVKLLKNIIEKYLNNY